MEAYNNKPCLVCYLRRKKNQQFILFDPQDSGRTIGLGCEFASNLLKDDSKELLTYGLAKHSIYDVIPCIPESKLRKGGRFMKDEAICNLPGLEPRHLIRSTQDFKNSNLRLILLYHCFQSSDYANVKPFGRAWSGRNQLLIRH